MRNIVLPGMHIWITFARAPVVAAVILDLEADWYSLRTEGNLIPSAAANLEQWC